MKPNDGPLAGHGKTVGAEPTLPRADQIDCRRYWALSSILRV